MIRWHSAKPMPVPVIFRLFMQTFEDYEYLFQVFLSNSNAIVSDREEPFVCRSLRGNVHLRTNVNLSILQCICQ